MGIVSEVSQTNTRVASLVGLGGDSWSCIPMQMGSSPFMLEGRDSSAARKAQETLSHFCTTKIATQPQPPTLHQSNRSIPIGCTFQQDDWQDNPHEGGFKYSLCGYGQLAPQRLSYCGPVTTSVTARTAIARARTKAQCLDAVNGKIVRRQHTAGQAMQRGEGMRPGAGEPVLAPGVAGSEEFGKPQECCHSWERQPVEKPPWEMLATQGPIVTFPSSASCATGRSCGRSCARLGFPRRTTSEVVMLMQMLGHRRRARHKGRGGLPEQCA
ncbi:hypothetical protein FN846DRAFT_896115 [Sphaerosporella brunnea]|uniref:Uncharacterized protein n=1 Tax=Sphaerosporella brunnea TaxID=1250544 RepID=A0A5J5ECM9_9PEZI|nr:hypothetical protein FN846DRAFT_896115 [Sphaerosporella brunnea]